MLSLRWISPTDIMCFTLKQFTQSYNVPKYRALLSNLRKASFAQAYIKQNIERCQNTQTLMKSQIDVSHFADDSPLCLHLECGEPNCYANRASNPHIRSDFENQTISHLRNHMQYNAPFIITTPFDTLSLTSVIIIGNACDPLKQNHLTLNIISGDGNEQFARLKSLTNAEPIAISPTMAHNWCDDSPQSINNFNIVMLTVIKTLEILTAAGYVNPEIRVYPSMEQYIEFVHANDCPSNATLGIDYLDRSTRMFALQTTKPGGIIALLRTPGLYQHRANIEIVSYNATHLAQVNALRAQYDMAMNQMVLNIPVSSAASIFSGSHDPILQNGQQFIYHHFAISQPMMNVYYLSGISDVDIDKLRNDLYRQMEIYFTSSTTMLYSRQYEPMLNRALSSIGSLLFRIFA